MSDQFANAFLPNIDYSIFQGQDQSCSSSNSENTRHYQMIFKLMDQSNTKNIPLLNKISHYSNLVPREASNRQNSQSKLSFIQTKSGSNTIKNTKTNHRSSPSSPNSSIFEVQPQFLQSLENDLKIDTTTSFTNPESSLLSSPTYLSMSQNQLLSKLPTSIVQPNLLLSDIQNFGSEKSMDTLSSNQLFSAPASNSISSQYKVENYNDFKLDFSIDEKKIKSNLLELHPINDHFNNFNFLDSQNQPVFFNFKGSIDGKFYLNEKFLKINEKNEIPIACYRRNYNSLHIYLEFSSKPETFIENDQCYHIETIRLTIECHSNFSPQLSEILIFDNNKNSKEEKNDNSIISLNNQFILFDSFQGERYIHVKRFQFKKATPNNGKSIAKDYYYLRVKLSLVISENLGVGNKRKQSFIRDLTELESNAISVRGRNPSFYTDRNDVLITRNISNQSIKQEMDQGSYQEQEQEHELSTSTDSLSPKEENIHKQHRYTYHPIKSNYYLPPVAGYYFPHDSLHKHI